jgi:hypothetical protein
MTRGGRVRRESSAACAIPKFESAWSGGTQRSSENQTVASLQSASCSAAIV